MSYLIDTNVVSELARPKPAPAVAAWFEEVADETLHLSVLTLGELRRRVEKLPAGKRKEKLRYWLEHEVPAWFGERLLPVDAFVADTWGRLQAVAERTLPAIDGLLAAPCVAGSHFRISAVRPAAITSNAGTSLRIICRYMD